MSGSKVKGILKYISHIFDTDKEQDIQIGYPTEVKHVAHIGWDGPSVNSPSWMNEFKTSPSSGMPADIQNKGLDNTPKKSSEASRRRSNRESSELPPKASKRQSMGGVTESPTREKSNKPRQSKKSNRPRDELSPGRIPDPFPPSNIPDIPKKSRRQKSKESSGGGSSKLRSKAQPSSDLGSPKTMSNPRSSFENNEEDNIISV